MAFQTTQESLAWSKNASIDLGNRRVRVLSTPGHTPTSVSLYDDQRRQLSQTGPGTRIYAAHMADPPAPVRAPTLEFADLKALEATAGGDRPRQHQSDCSGEPGHSGFFPTSISGTWGSGIRDGLFLEQSLIKLTALNIRWEF